jgi:hypothetical protein
MAREYIKGAGDALTPVGDTQGLLVPSPLKHAEGDFKAATLPVNAVVTLTPNAGPDSLGVTIDAASGRVYVARSGLYLAEFRAPVKNALDATPFIGQIGSPGYETLGPTRPALFYSGITTSGIYASSAGTIQLQAGEWVSFLLQNNGAGAAASQDNSGRWALTLLQEQAPYIVANKGALVSSPDPGKIAIDPDSGEMRLNNQIEDLSSSITNIIPGIDFAEISYQSPFFFKKNGIYYFTGYAVVYNGTILPSGTHAACTLPFRLSKDISGFVQYFNRADNSSVMTAGWIAVSGEFNLRHNVDWTPITMGEIRFDFHFPEDLIA